MEEINNNKPYRECEVSFDEYSKDLLESYNEIRFSDLELIFKNLKSLFKKKGYIVNWKELEKQSLDQTINTLYSVISGDKGVERDWSLFKSLFHPDAKLIPSGPSQDGNFQAIYLSPDDYINRSGKWLYENGFHEREIHRVTDIFGNIAHIFSTYEAFRESSDEIPFMRGINSIQLMKTNEKSAASNKAM